MSVSLRAVPLFAELSESDLAAIESRSTVVQLAAGEPLFAEGDAGERAYVISEGEIEITKRTGERDVLLAVRKPGEVIGEMALVQDAPRSASARAKTDSRLIAIPKAEIDALMESSLGAVRALFNVLLDRWQSTQALLKQSERMAQLGTLTAGLAHELNNPAAAVARSVGQLRTSVEQLVAAERALASAAPNAQDGVISLRERVRERSSQSRLAEHATSFDVEDAVEAALIDAGIVEAWRFAPAIVEAGLDDMVGDIVEAGSDHAGELIEVLFAEHEVGSLLHEVEEGTRRLSDIVRALKSYSYLDQGPVQEVDVVSGLEDTLLILKSKLADISINRQFAADLPRIQAYGGELNQVWTNLIDNAADAIHETGAADGTITLRASSASDEFVVEVEDNGPGIPPEAVHRVFDSFFTTKPPGSGTGLGLNISYSIVIDKHGGDITVDSQPGRTVFRVVLPHRVPD